MMQSVAVPRPPEFARPPWRALALLTALVVFAHLALLGLAPMAAGPKPSPLANKFITRTIVIAPPVAETAVPPPAGAPTAAPAPPRAKPRPRPVARPSAPLPAPQSAPPPELPGPDLTAQAPTDPSPAPDPVAEPVPPAATAATPAADAPPAPIAAVGSDVAGQIAGAVPLRIPGSVRLNFAVTAQQGTTPMQGVFGELVWLQDGQKYDARLTLTFLFRTVRTQHSAGSIGATGIEPDRFSETRKTEVASHFVRDQGTVVFSNNAPTLPLLAGAQDRLSIVMQLGALLAGDPAHYPPGATIAVQTVGPRDAEIWVFNLEGEEPLSVPAGEFAVRKLVREPRKPFDDKLELWVAPALGYLPVRIKQTQSGGDFADLQLREVLPLRQ